MRRGPMRGAAYAIAIEACASAILCGAWWIALRVLEATGAAK